MSTSQIIWLVVAIVAVLLIAGAAVWASQRRGTQRREQERIRADQLRSEAESQRTELRETELSAREAQVEAERARLEAERADARAAEAQQGLQVDEARFEDQVREADRIDPDVDHRADEYRPGTQPPAQPAEPIQQPTRSTSTPGRSGRS